MKKWESPLFLLRKSDGIGVVIRKTEIEKSIFALMCEPLEHEGFTLVDACVVGSETNCTVEIYIDADGGITLDKVACASRIVDTVLEEKDLFASNYTLEVSSPGIDRPLVHYADFVSQSGSEVTIRFLSGDKKKRIKGVLTQVSQDWISIDSEKGVKEIAVKDIVKANIVGIVDFKKEK